MMERQVDEYTAKYMRFVGHHVVMLTTAYGDYRLYGPFTNGAESREWMDKQFDAGFRGSFSIVPLRTPDRDRQDSNDWWGTDHSKSREWMEAEYPHSDWSVFPAVEASVE